MFFEDYSIFDDHDDLTLSDVIGQNLCKISSNTDTVFQMLRCIADKIRIVKDTKHGDYYYPLYFDYRLFFTYHNIRSQIYKLPSRVIQDLHDNQAKILCINTAEGYDLELWKKVIAEQILNPYNLSYNHVVILSATVDTGFHCDIDNIYHNLWETKTSEYFTYDSQILEKCLEKLYYDQNKDHKFICLLRKPQPYRLVLYSNLYLYKNKGILTCGPLHSGEKNDLEDVQKIRQAKKLFPSQQNNVLIGIRSTIPRIYDADLSDQNMHLANPTLGDTNIKKYIDSHIHIVAETYFDRNTTGVFFSEKTFKPMIFLQPFVLFGQPGSLTELRRQGYKTFEPFIDESYDQILDHEKRFQAALNEVKRLISLSNQELIEMQHQLIHVLLHNYYHIKNISVKKSKKLYKDLQKAIRK